MSMHINTSWLTGHEPHDRVRDLVGDARAKEDGQRLSSQFEGAPAPSARAAPGRVPEKLPPLLRQLVNLTPHTVVIRGITFAPTTPPARVSVEQEEVAKVWLKGQNGCAVPVVRSRYGEVENLPEYDPMSDRTYIVSRLVVQACPDRDDLFFPDCLVRDADGRITGADALGAL